MINLTWRSLFWLALALAGCGSVAPGTLRLQVSGETKLRVSPDGAIVLDKERVATLKDDGKVVVGSGKIWAWVHDRSIRLAGGAELPIKTDQRGALYLPLAAQQAAGLKPVTTRVARNGDVVGETGSATRLRVEGVDGEKHRRVALLLLVLMANPPEGRL